MGSIACSCQSNQRPQPRGEISELKDHFRPRSHFQLVKLEGQFDLISVLISNSLLFFENVTRNFDAIAKTFFVEDVTDVILDSPNTDLEF